MEEFANLLFQGIGTLGFPIMAYIGLFWYMYIKDKQHREEIQLLAEGINRLSSLIERIDAKLDREAPNNV